MSSQESQNSNDERELNDFDAQPENQGWPRDAIRRAIRETRCEAEQWTQVRPARRAKLAELRAELASGPPDGRSTAMAVSAAGDNILKPSLT